MNYQYLENMTTADVAFEAWGPTVEEMFIAAADATMNTMVNNLSAIKTQIDIRLELVNQELDLLLFNFLNEFLFYKDSQRLLLRVKHLSIAAQNSFFELDAVLSGEKLNPERHQLAVDVKAVTLHNFSISQSADGWKATVILDI
jgi:SHS2 domain-containing protein